MLAIVLTSISIKVVEVHASFKQEQNLVSKIQKKQRETNLKLLKSKQATNNFISNENTKENKEDNTKVKSDLKEKKTSPKEAIRKETSKVTKKVSKVTTKEEVVIDSSIDAKTQEMEVVEHTGATNDFSAVPDVTTTSQSQQYKEKNDSDLIDDQSKIGEQPNEEPETIESEEVKTSEVETTDTDSAINPNTFKQEVNQNTGFCFLGYSFPLSIFEGSGNVPHWTPYVYQWADDPSHFLFERQSDAGQAVLNLNIRDQVVVNGNTYSI